ncbi:hypothetical protein L208DRAFT_1417171 [Tricholoma matsutake]|nr:hypothetical protein L208DRAFT_1417171 [Tricholoma matsutake 945]
MKRKSQTAETTMTYKFYWAQLHGEQTKKKLVETGKRWAHMTMDQYKCSGWLFVTLNENELTMACIHITHYRCHPPYADISISDSIVKEIEGPKDMTAAKKYPKTDLMQKHIYVHWAHLHEATW